MNQRVLQILGTIAVLGIFLILLVQWLGTPSLGVYVHDRDMPLVYGDEIEVSDEDHIFVSRSVEVTFTSSYAFILTSLSDRKVQKSSSLVLGQSGTLHTVTFTMEGEWELTTQGKVTMTTTANESVKVVIHEKI